jgi:hypothetical protein
VSAAGSGHATTRWAVVHRMRHCTSEPPPVVHRAGWQQAVVVARNCQAGQVDLAAPAAVPRLERTVCNGRETPNVRRGASAYSAITLNVPTISQPRCSTTRRQESRCTPSDVPSTCSSVDTRTYVAARVPNAVMTASSDRWATTVAPCRVRLDQQSLSSRGPVLGG